MPASAVILGLCQFLFMAALAVGISFNGLVGKILAPSPVMATLPFLFMMGSTAMLTLLMPRFLSISGYKKVFLVGALTGAAGGGLAAISIYYESFIGFCFAGFLMGIYQASFQYYRFAAADAVEDKQKSSAIAWVLSGGILAALIGPILGSHSLHWLPVEYTGSYLVAAILAAIALPIILMAPIASRKSQKLSPVEWKNIPPNAFAAILVCTGGYAMMAMVMLASPLAMSNCGFKPSDAAGVIQWHLLGMFAPSLITGKLIGRFGAQTIAFTGIAILAAGCCVALMGTQLLIFDFALLIVGIGWNLMYMSGSTILTQIPDVSMRSRLQSINEFITFSIVTIVSGLAGWMYASLGWQAILNIALVVLFSIAVTAVYLSRLVKQRLT